MKNKTLIVIIIRNIAKKMYPVLFSNKTKISCTYRALAFVIVLCYIFTAIRMFEYNWWQPICFIPIMLIFLFISFS